MENEKIEILKNTGVAKEIIVDATKEEDDDSPATFESLGVRDAWIQGQSLE